MSSSKRKSIVFDLGGENKTKSPRIQERNAVHRRNTQYREAVDEDPPENWVSFMQPEILTMSFMMEVLDQCNVRSSTLMGKSKEEIEKLFLKFASPKPQRKHKSTRLGKALALLQLRLAGTNVPEWHKMVVESTSPRHKKRKASVSKGGNSIPSPSSSGDRLKPPLALQSLINTDRKKIKLGSSSASSSPVKVVSSSDKIDSLLKSKASNSSNSEANKDLELNVKRKISPSKDNGESPKKLITEKQPAKKHSSVAWP